MSAQFVSQTVRTATGHWPVILPAPAEQLFAEFGFTVDNVVAKAQALLK